jgi:hypothetical protein
MSVQILPVEEVCPVGTIEGQSREVPNPLRDRRHFVSVWRRRDDLPTYFRICESLARTILEKF